MGIVGVGILVIEGCCGEGGYFLNKDGDCFMECYVLNVKDLVGWDVVVCLMMIEICEGCGCEGLWGMYIKFKFDYFGKDVFEFCLLGIFELLCIFVYVDLVKELILVIFICYYMMGGIFINVDG